MKIQPLTESENETEEEIEIANTARRVVKCLTMNLTRADYVAMNRRNGNERFLPNNVIHGCYTYQQGLY
jgi:hypothetical protein